MTADYIHLFESVSGTPSRCRILIYLSEEEGDAPVVVCSELADNPCIPVTGAAENIAAEVIAAHYKVRETVGPTGSRLEIGEPLWKPLDRHSVEVLVGQVLE